MAQRKSPGSPLGQPKAKANRTGWLSKLRGGQGKPNEVKASEMDPEELSEWHPSRGPFPTD